MSKLGGYAMTLGAALALCSPEATTKRITYLHRCPDCGIEVESGNASAIYCQFRHKMRRMVVVVSGAEEGDRE